MHKNALCFLILSLVACGGSEPAPAPEAAPAPAPEPAPVVEEAAPAPAPAPAAAENNAVTPDEEGIVRIEAQDNMMFNTARIEVSGNTIKLELKHTGQLAKNVMGHNLVVLQPGTDPIAWAAGTFSMVDTDYVPPDDETVIAATKLLGGGEVDLIEFEVPGPGEYPFVCSFPGHAAIMKGVLVVTE